MLQLNNPGTDRAINKELTKMSASDLRLLERYIRSFAGDRKREAELLGSIANGLNDPHGLARGAVERIKQFITEIVKQELSDVSFSNGRR